MSHLPSPLLVHRIREKEILAAFDLIEANFTIEYYPIDGVAHAVPVVTGTDIETAVKIQNIIIKLNMALEHPDTIFD